MTYVIKINDDSTPQARSLLMLLKSLANDYNFLTFAEEDDKLTPEMKEELDFRYEHFIKHSGEYKDWDEIKHKYAKQ